MISHRYKFIFIHIDKNAGNSIETVLAPYCDDTYEFSKISMGHIKENRPDEDITTYNEELGTAKHSTLQAYYDAMGDKIWDYHKFCCIRNPFDRIVSAAAFSAGANGLSHINTNYAFRKVQMEFIKINGKVAIDDHIRFENIQVDFDRICEKLGISKTELPKKNVSDHSNYKDYYNAEVQQKVYEYCKETIDYFGYEF